MNEDRELQWDDTITNDGQDYITLPEGDYDTIAGLVVELLVLILIPLAFIIWYGVCLAKAQNILLDKTEREVKYLVRILECAADNLDLVV